MARKRERWHLRDPPGTLAAHPEADREPVRINLFRYDATSLEGAHCPPGDRSLSVPESGVLWLDICGLSDPGVVRAVGAVRLSLGLKTC